MHLLFDQRRTLCFLTRHREFGGARVLALALRIVPVRFDGVQLRFARLDKAVAQCKAIPVQLRNSGALDLKRWVVAAHDANVPRAALVDALEWIEQIAPVLLGTLGVLDVQKDWIASFRMRHFDRKLGKVVHSSPSHVALGERSLALGIWRHAVSQYVARVKTTQIVGPNALCVTKRPIAGQRKHLNGEIALVVACAALGAVLLHCACVGCRAHLLCALVGRSCRLHCCHFDSLGCDISKNQIAIFVHVFSQDFC